MSPTAIDLFSGAGGASLGLVRAGWDLRLATDVDLACSLTHRANLPGEFLTADLRSVDAAKVMSAADVSPGQLDLLFAGPPCQGFSIIGSRVVWDKRNNLFKEVLRLASELQPRCVVIENVPGLVTLAGGAYLQAILEGLNEAGYEAACAELLAAQYGAPQMRWRLIIIGWRKDLGIPAGYGFPRPTAGMARSGICCRTALSRQWQLEGFVTTAEAIGDLPPVAAGEEVTHYVGPPAGPYQKMMRAGLNGELSNHYAARLSPANLTRLAAYQAWPGLARPAAGVAARGHAAGAAEGPHAPVSADDMGRGASRGDHAVPGPEVRRVHAPGAGPDDHDPRGGQAPGLPRQLRVPGPPDQPVRPGRQRRADPAR